MVAPEIKILAVTLLAEGANVSCCFHFWSSGTFVMPLTEREGGHAFGDVWHLP